MQTKLDNGKHINETNDGGGDNGTGRYMVSYGDNMKNDEKDKVIELCIEDGLIANTRFM